MNYLNMSSHPCMTSSQDSLLCTIVNTLRNNTNANFTTETASRSPMSPHKPSPCRLVDDFTSSLHLFFPIKHLTKQKQYEAYTKSSLVAPLIFEQDLDDNNYLNSTKSTLCSFANQPNDIYFNSYDSLGTSHTFYHPCYPMTSPFNNMNHDLNTIFHVNSNSSSLPMYPYMEMDPTSFENFNVSMLFPQASKFNYEEDSENDLIFF